jgi:hypothetical protein
MADNISENEPATKGDINLLKGDIELVKTELKSDIKRLDHKIGQMDQKVGQLDKTVLSLGVEVSKTQLRMDKLENNIMAALRSFKSEILCSIDAFAGEAKDYRRKDLDRGHTLMVHDDKLQNHETRITLLETGK